MEARGLAGALALLALLAPLAAAQTPTPLTLNVNRELKVLVVYPLEVKYGSWIRMLFDVTSAANVTVGEMRVRVVFVYESGAVVLFDGPIIQGKPMPPGYQVQRAVEFTVAIPAPRPPVEPFLELYITINYTVDGAPRYYELKAPVSIVVRSTYSELVSALAQAQEKAQLADQLAQQVAALEAKLANATGVCALLAQQAQRLSAENTELKLQLGALRAANASLAARVAKLEAENALLRNELAALREERGGLASRLTSVESSYASLSSEYAALRREYEALAAQALALKVALAAAAAAAAALAAYLVLHARRGPARAPSAQSADDPPEPSAGQPAGNPFTLLD